MRFLLILLATLLWARSASAVINGQPSSDHHAATVALRDRDQKLVCSGVLIAPRIVLTAAHCFPSEEVDVADACFGSSTTNCSATIAIERHELHPEWAPLSFTFDHDLALVFLATDAPAPPITIADNDPRPGERIDIVGFGRTNPKSSASAGTKHYASLTVDAIESDRVVHGEAACKGDSGGPITLRNELIAITSSGPAGCRDLGKATIVTHNTFVRDALRRSENNDRKGGCSTSNHKTSGTELLLLLFVVLHRRFRIHQHTHRPYQLRKAGD